MKIVIIEDEPHAAGDLARTLKKMCTGLCVDATLTSVREALAYFDQPRAIDLIFSDIQLGDGLSFSIFRQIGQQFPVVFCTAYDQYAIEAFRTLGIDYILKPVSDAAVGEALRKYEVMKLTLGQTVFKPPDWQQLLPGPKKSLLVHFRDKIIPLSADAIAMVFLKAEVTYALAFDRQRFILQESLEDAERKLGPSFFRANRQCLINHSAIKEASRFFGRKLLIVPIVPFEDKILVSKEKSPQFLDWLAGEK